MNKISIVIITLLSALTFTSCDQDVEAPEVMTVYHGYYAYGSATPFSDFSDACKMVDGIEVGQANRFMSLNSGTVLVRNEYISTIETPTTINYGLDTENNFVENGANEIQFTLEEGNYIFRTDTINNSIDFVKINGWGIIGSATPGGWGSDTDMTLESSDNGVYIYTVTADLVGGEWLKFRANDQWAPQFGVNNGVLTLRLYDSESDPGSIKVEESGNFTVKLILGTEFTYQLIKNS